MSTSVGYCQKLFSTKKVKDNVIRMLFDVAQSQSESFLGSQLPLGFVLLCFKYILYKELTVLITP